MSQSCGICRFCLLTDDTRGLCRRRPPRVFRETTAGEKPETFLHSHYPPVTLADLGCAEYRPRYGPLGREIVRFWRSVVSL
jgi:hypothetical protein